MTLVYVWPWHTYDSCIHIYEWYYSCIRMTIAHVSLVYMYDSYIRITLIYVRDLYTYDSCIHIEWCDSCIRMTRVYVYTSDITRVYVSLLYTYHICIRMTLVYVYTSDTTLVYVWLLYTYHICIRTLLYTYHSSIRINLVTLVYVYLSKIAYVSVCVVYTYSCWDCYGSFDEQRLFPVKFARFRNSCIRVSEWDCLCECVCRVYV